jgi:two-component system sensor histidine kinase QseC
VLHDMLADLLTDQAARLTAKGGRLDLDASLSAIQISANPTLLALAMRNLVENAVNHSPDGGTVRIALRGEAILVEDEGPGLPEDELARATERFFRGRNRVAVGSGLGLSIVAQCAERLGGTLSLTNRGGNGLRATLSVPDLAG